MDNRFSQILMIVSCCFAFGFVGTANAQAGSACAGTACGLGGQIRAQFGYDSNLIISRGRARGPLNCQPPFCPYTPPSAPSPFVLKTIMSAPFPSAGPLPLVGNGLGVPGPIKPTPLATIMQTTTSAPRALTLAPGVFRVGDLPPATVAVANFSFPRFMVQTDLEFDIPHPGTTRSGAPAMTFSGGAIPTSMANVLSAGGRIGAATLTYYANATTLGPGSPTNNFGAGATAPTPMAGEAGPVAINGVARFTATRNQFGGQMIGRVTGTKRVYFNFLPIVPGTALPCKVTATPGQGTTAMGPLVPFQTGPDCQFALSVVDRTASDATVDIRGGAFGERSSLPMNIATPRVFTGTIGFNGTILGQGAPVTSGGSNIPFAREGVRGVGFPMTTGMLSITVTDVLTTTSEMFVRTGTDARTAGGNGVVALVGGSMTVRDISGGNANRTWVTLEIPEPSAAAAAGMGLLALAGCHAWVRRRAEGRRSEN